MKITSSTKITSSYFFITAIAVLFSWFIHEFVHYLMGELLGYDMAMTINKAFPTSGSYKQDWHYQVISAAGPFITIIEAFIVYALMRKKNRPLLYPFLFTCFYLRLLAGIISFSTLNDEARISKAIGLGTFTLPVLVAAILLYPLYKISEKYGFTKRQNFATLGLIILFSSIIILSDQYLKLRIF